MQVARPRAIAQFFTDHPVFRNIERLHAAGYALIPLGGDDGKKPLVSGWHKRRPLPLDVVVQIMGSNGSFTYGVRLDGLIVVDVDTTNQVSQEYIRSRFGHPAVVVATSRGQHLYFRETDFVPKRVDLPDIAIDFKSGSSAYVVGPGSVRPDGRSYTAVTGTLGETPITNFIDRRPDGFETSSANAMPSRIAKGGRNTALCRVAIASARDAKDVADIAAQVRAFCEHSCAEPSSVGAKEIHDIAEWAWRCRLKNKVYAGRNSDMQISRIALDALQAHPKGHRAALLYMHLVACHGHRSGKRFEIVPDDLIKQGWTMPRSATYAARRILIDAGLISLARKGVCRKRIDAGSRREADEFILARPHGSNALPFIPQALPSREGEGFLLKSVVPHTDKAPKRAGPK